MRIQNSLKNIGFGLTGQIISLGMGFIVRTVFIGILGIEYLGVSGLFTGVLMVMSLASLGFDTAIIYSLYKPIAEDDKKQILSLMNLYKKAYSIIGIIVFVLGLSLLPFLSYLMSGETSVNHIEIIYILFVIQSASSYFFVYKQSIIIADQKNHIISKILSVFTILSSLAQIALLLWTKDFIIVLSSQILIGILKNAYIVRKANTLYPYLKGKNDHKLSGKDKKHFFKNMYSLMMYKISGVVINGTDSIVISKFIGVVAVGMYSNYLLILSTLSTFLSYIFYSLTASVGNLNLQETSEKKHSVFKIIQFSSFWVYGLFTVCLLNLMNPFIIFWLGEEYVFSQWIVIAILLNFFTSGMQAAATTFRDTTGLFQKGKYSPVIAAIINLGVSIVLVNYIGIAGVFLGTVISRFCTYFWFDPYVIYKSIFNQPVRSYFLRYIGYSLTVLVSAFFTKGICSLMSGMPPFWDLFLDAIVSVTVTCGLFIAVYWKTAEFLYLLNLVKGLFSRLGIIKKNVELKVNRL